jgi:hypothetical protein
MRYLVLPPAQAPPAGGTGDWKQVFPPPAPSSVPTTAPTPPRADAVVYENPAALPRAWMATRAEGFATQAQAVARTRAMDFDPRELVIGDWDIDSDDFEWLTRPNSRMRQAKPLSPQEYFGVRGRDVGARTSREARIIWLEDSPERVRLRIENGGGGWLVLADAYMNGWQAKINNPAWGAYERDRPIVPAYGLLRTLRVNESANETVDVIMEYRPAAYHRGLMLTTGAAAALVLLLGFWFIGVRRNGKIQPPEGASWTNGFGSTARSCG